MNHNHRFHIVRVSQQSKHSQSHNHMELPVRAWWAAASAPPLAGGGRGRPPRTARTGDRREGPLAPPPAPWRPGRPLRVGGPAPLGASGLRAASRRPCSWRLGKAPARRRPRSLGRRWLREKPSAPPIPWGLGMAPARRRPAPLEVGALRAARTPAVAGGAAASRPPTH